MNCRSRRRFDHPTIYKRSMLLMKNNTIKLMIVITTLFTFNGCCLTQNKADLTITPKISMQAAIQIAQDYLTIEKGITAFEKESVKVIEYSTSFFLLDCLF
jgi:hypothetical protein